MYERSRKRIRKLRRERTQSPSFQTNIAQNKQIETGRVGTL